MSNFLVGLRAAVVVLLCAGVICNESVAKPFLWQIKHPARTGTVYLIGSIHVLHDYDVLPSVFDTVLYESDKAIFEVDPDDSSGDDLFAASLYLTTPGDSLKNYLQPTTYSLLEGFLRARRYEWFQYRPGPILHFSQYTPIAIDDLVSFLKRREAGLSGRYGVDWVLLEAARSAGIKTEFLESAGFQERTLQLSFKDPDKEILSSMNSNPNRVVALWTSGDAAAIAASVRNRAAADPSGSYLLLDQRNLNWLPKIDAELHSLRKTLVVVGAAHLFGPNGLLELLRKKGCVLERLPAPVRPVTGPKYKNTLSGSNIRLMGAVLGTPPLSYDWYKDGNLIYGADWMQLWNVQLSDSGTYAVRASNQESSTNLTSTVLSVYNLGDFTPVFLQSGARNNAVWLMNNTNFVASVLFRNGQALNAGWRTVGARDFNSDNHVDLLLQHDDGRLALWLMRGADLDKGIFLKAPGRAWRVAAVNDFNADQHTDILFRSADGRLAVWYFEDGSFSSANIVNGGKPVSLEWRLAAAGDFSGDGKPDVLWQSKSGALSIWVMDGVTITSKQLVRSGVPIAAKAIGTGDFNRNGTSDILFMTSNRQMFIGYMGGNDFTASPWLRGGQTLPLSDPAIVNATGNLFRIATPRPYRKLRTWRDWDILRRTCPV